jgi:undecaprenyl diphosphate synthase
VDAVKAIVAAGIPASKVDEGTVRKHLYAPELPDPDLVIRTSGEYRISNFLLWELAYSELVFSDVLWPDFRRAHLAEAIREYQARERRYGSTAGSRDDGIP